MNMESTIIQRKKNIMRAKSQSVSLRIFTLRKKKRKKEILNKMCESYLFPEKPDTTGDG
jgi:hypothetical protein